MSRFHNTMSFINEISPNREYHDDIIAYMQSLSTNDVNLLKDYTDQGYESLNNILRAGHTTGKTESLMRIIGEAPAYPRELTVYRKTHHLPNEGPTLFRGFVSTTTDHALGVIGSIDEHSVVLVIYLPAGTHLIPWDEMGEHEILLQDRLSGTVKRNGMHRVQRHNNVLILPRYDITIF